MSVPLDHSDPALGTGKLYVETGAPFDPAKPTVLIVADGQQFYVRPGVVAGLQESTFGAEFNIVGLIGRGFSEDFQKLAGAGPNGVDWVRAWRIFNSGQWVEDIEAVRRLLVGPEGKVLLYGVSGGGFLLHQYLAAHGDHVRRAFAAAAPVRPIDAELRILHDHFWQEIGQEGTGLREKLLGALAARPEERPMMIRLLQRQNFFVTPDRLPAERAALIEELARNDRERLAARREAYQVDAIGSLLEQPMGPAIRVRIYESVQPVVDQIGGQVGAAGAVGCGNRVGGPVHPNIENECDIARPLLEAHAAGSIPAPRVDFARLHDLDTEVFVLAGRLDHTADYRSAIALASMYKNSILFIARDSHMLSRLKDDGTVKKLVSTFLAKGIGSAELMQLIGDCGKYRWTEEE